MTLAINTLYFFATEIAAVSSPRRLTYGELVSLLSTFFLIIHVQAIECRNYLAALSDFQKTLKQNRDDLTVEEV